MSAELGIDVVRRFGLSFDRSTGANFQTSSATGAQLRIDPHLDQVAANAGGTFLVMDVGFELVSEITQSG